MFSAVYLLATLGILVGQHLCMDRVKEKALFAKVETHCGMAMEMHKDMMMDCCKDEWLLEKVEDDQQVSAFKTAPEARYHLLYTITLAELIESHTFDQQDFEVKNTGPPDISPPDLVVLYHNLKIPAALQS